MTPIEKLLLIPIGLGCFFDFANLLYFKQNWDPDAKRVISHILFLPQLLLYLAPVVILLPTWGIVSKSASLMVVLHLALVRYVLKNKEYGKRCSELHERHLLELNQEA